MAFLSRFFKRNKTYESSEEDWENLVFDRQYVDFQDEEQRSRYITNCLEQIAEASKEVNLLTGEYTLITSYLTDMEEIEALPTEEREDLNGIARRLLALEKECEAYRSKKNRMSDSEYHHMKKYEDDVQQGISKLKECESYGGLIKQDLQRLGRERHAFEYRKSELEAMMNNYREMTVIFIIAFIVCLIALLGLYLWKQMNVKVGCLLAVGFVALAATCIQVKYTNREQELKRVKNAINKLIQLQNKVKIRYVNNNNLQDYLRIKYNAEDSGVLQKRWDLYQQEKEERREFAESEAKIEYYQKQLVHKMSQYRVTDPDRWVDQPGALLDKREMVEIRHELIISRQSLRKQMDYNNTVAETAKNEVMDIADRYPEYASEILTMVDQYESES